MFLTVSIRERGCCIRWMISWVGFLPHDHFMYTLMGVPDEEVLRMRASDRAYATLLDEIQSGVLRPGTVLGEVDQAARLGVSRTPLREALGRLGADGLVAQQSPRVTVVTAIDAGDIREIFEVRRALEESAARLAAERGDAAADAAVANDYLTSALRTVRTHLVRVRRLSRENPARLAASISEHRLIAAAIAARDADLAAHATHVHLHNALTNILAAVDESATTLAPLADAHNR